MPLKSYFLLLSLIVSCYTISFAQVKPELKLEQIMQGEQFIGVSPDNFRWSADGTKLIFDWNPDSLPDKTPYALNPKTGSYQKMSFEEIRCTQLDNGPRNRKGNLQIQIVDGDLYLYDRLLNNRRAIIQTMEPVARAIFSRDESEIVFLQANQVYSFRLSDGLLKQITNIQQGSKSKSASKSQQGTFLENQQAQLFDVVEKRKSAREWYKMRHDSLESPNHKTLYINNLQSISLCPDPRFIYYRNMPEMPRNQNTLVADYLNPSGYTSNLQGREKVGAARTTYQSSIYDSVLDTAYAISTDSLVDIRRKPDFLKSYYKDTLPYSADYDKSRPVIVLDPVFSTDGRAVVEVRSQDYKDRWICALNMISGKLQLIDHQHDEAWIGGPGIGGDPDNNGNVGWMPDDQHIYYQSEISGYSNLYSSALDGSKKTLLTGGKFEVLEAYFSGDKKYFYISANFEGPGTVHFYKLPVVGGKLIKLTNLPGRNDVVVSPDEKYFAIRRSYSNQPWELYLQENKEGAVAKQITYSTKSAFNAYPWRDPELVYFAANDGVKVPARLYRSKSSATKGPAVIFVHGAGYLQNVHNWWSHYYREYMFHNLLADKGYTVLDIDYRASSGYGRDWRTAIYRYMGGRDLQDQIDGAKYLVDSLNVDAQRMGIYGGSYGGFITLMAMSTSPGTFQAGAALRSVTDWAHYNEGYTAAILNTPLEDSIAFYRSSPINFAKDLQGELLMLHGVVDVNVQYQDVMRYAQRLIELGKDHWQLTGYPVEDHGFVEASSWTDEYRRILELFESTIGTAK